MKPNEVLQVTTWNMLNPSYENEDWYTAKNIPFLHWSKGRRELALNYLIPLDSDIFSLQETTFEIIGEITNTLKTKLSHRDYGLIFETRKSQDDDGCGVIYDKNKLTLLKHIPFTYEGYTHIMLACQFKLNNSPVQFWIVNTHVNWNERARDLLVLKKTVDQLGEKCLVMGDFNATSDEKWYKIFTESGILDTFREVNQKAPLVTYNSGQTKKAIDYLLVWPFQKEQIVVVSSFLGNQPKAPLSPDSTHGELPNKEIPSDHVPMTTVFSFK